MLTCHVAEPSRPPHARLLRARCAGSLGSRKRPETGIVEVERTVSLGGTISLGSRVVLVAWMLAGRPVGVWIEDGAPLLFFWAVHWDGKGRPDKFEAKGQVSGPQWSNSAGGILGGRPLLRRRTISGLCGGLGRR